MKTEIDKLTAENDMLRKRKDQLEMQQEEYLIGEDTKNARVLHIANNPLTNYLTRNENAVEKLRAENEKLKRKILNLEKGLESSHLNISINPNEIEKLQDQMQKLKEYFKSSMQEFRNVVYMLLGYKIDKTNSQYKLTSMYAETETDSLYFQLNTEGSLDLLENQFSSALEDMIDLHLRHQKSIPVFLSSLTINTFNSHSITMNLP